MRVAAAALLSGLMTAMPHAQGGPAPRIDAYASRHAGDGRMQITAVADVPAGTTLTAATISVLDTRGIQLAQWKVPAPLLSAHTVTTTFVQDAGEYRVRVATIDSAHRTASADVNVTATLTTVAGGLSVSAIALGIDANTFAPRRQFTNEPQALARFELYGGKTGMPVSVTMELAATGVGPAIARLSPKIAPTAEPDRFIVTAPVNLGGLAAGNYVIRAVAGVDGQPATAFQGTFELGQRAKGGLGQRAEGGLGHRAEGKGQRRGKR